MYKLLLILLFSLTPAQQCVYSSECPEGMCRKWEGSRFVCEHDTVAIMVYDAKCINKIEMSDKMKMETPLINGEPDKDHFIIYGLKVNYKTECGHIEIRHR